MEVSCQIYTNLGRVLPDPNASIFNFPLIIKHNRILQRPIEIIIENLLHLSRLKNDIIDILMKELLRIEIKIIMFFALAKEFLFQSVPALVQVFAHFEMLGA